MEEGLFQHTCVYCDKLNLLDDLRNICLVVQESYTDAVKECVSLKSEIDEYNGDIKDLNELAENMRSANSNLVTEYESKLSIVQEEVVNLNEQLAGFEGSMAERYFVKSQDQLLSNYEESQKKNLELIDRMEQLITSNTKLLKDNRLLKTQLGEDVKKGDPSVPRTPILVMSSSDEVFRAKIKADISRQYRDDIEKIKEEFNEKFNILKKSFTVK